MRTFLTILGLWLLLAARVLAAETLTQTDGTSVTGDIVKTDDNGVMVHTTSDAYATIEWGKLSQDSLKHLADNPKLKAYVDPFIEPTAKERPPKQEVKITYEQRVTLPEHPSIFGGLVGSSLGLFLLLVIYAANLYAAFEVAVVRGQPLALVIGLSAVLPIIGPIIFLAQSTKRVSMDEPTQGEPAPGEPGYTPTSTIAVPGQEEVQVVGSSWQSSQEEKKAEPQVFSRGKFTFNKRFIETKFAGFIGEPKGEAKTNSMSMKTSKGVVTVECIKQVGAAEAILETPHGQMTVAFADIQEVILTPKPA